MNVRDLLLRLFLDPPAADLPEMLLPVPEARHAEEEVRIAAADGRPLRGIWVRPAGGPERRRGAVVFLPAFEETAAAWRRHVGFLPDEGWAVLALDFRGQGASPAEPGYRPRKWATDREVRDAVAAVAEARRRAGGPVALVGVSRGAAAAAAAAAEAPVAALVLDSAVSTRHAARERAPRFARIYVGRRGARLLGPLYGPVVDWTLREAERREGVRLVRLEEVLARLRLPILLVWGEADSLAAGHRAEVAAAAAGAEVWIAPGAGHNAPAVAATAEYRRRVLGLLDRAAAARAA